MPTRTRAPEATADPLAVEITVADLDGGPSFDDWTGRLAVLPHFGEWVKLREPDDWRYVAGVYHRPACRPHEVVIALSRTPRAYPPHPTEVVGRELG